jgi:hypothetical protein
MSKLRNPKLLIIDNVNLMNRMFKCRSIYIDVTQYNMNEMNQIDSAIVGVGLLRDLNVNKNKPRINKRDVQRESE